MFYLVVLSSYEAVKDLFCREEFGDRNLMGPWSDRVKGNTEIGNYAVIIYHIFVTIPIKYLACVFTFTKNLPDCSSRHDRMHFALRNDVLNGTVAIHE